MSLESIEKQALRLSMARSQMRAVTEELESEIHALKRRFRKRLETAFSAAVQEQNALYLLVESNPGAFEKPRTQVYHGIRVGYRKQIGGIEWDDDDQVVRLIRKHLPDQAEVLVRVQETPNRQALKELPASDLKRIGCQVTETGDQIVVKPVDNEIDRQINALLKEKLGELAEEKAV